MTAGNPTGSGIAPAQGRGELTPGWRSNVTAYRRLLKLQQTALCWFGSDLSGWVRLSTLDDYVDGFYPTSWSASPAPSARVQGGSALRAQCQPAALAGRGSARLGADHLYAGRWKPASATSVNRPVGAPPSAISPMKTEPLPLALFQAGCPFLRLGAGRSERLGRPYRIVSIPAPASAAFWRRRPPGWR